MKDIYAKKAESRKAKANLPLSEKLAIMESINEMIAPLVAIRKQRDADREKLISELSQIKYEELSDEQRKILDSYNIGKKMAEEIKAFLAKQ